MSGTDSKQEQDGGADWRVEDVEWDPVSMVVGPGGARPSPHHSHGDAAPNGSGCASPSCQVEGCSQALQLRSYYRRQRICEEHFRAATITDGSGRVWRFCQQCAKLEALAEFEGERRSCRASLARRHRRRTGRRDSGQRKSGRRSAEGGACGTPGIDGNGAGIGGIGNGSGSGSGFAVHQLGPVPPTGVATSSGTGSGSGGSDRFQWQRSVQPPEVVVQCAAAGQQAAQHSTCMGPGLGGLDVDSLLAMDPDLLADAMLASAAVGHVLFQVPAISPGTDSVAWGPPAASQWGLPLPALAPDRDAALRPAALPGPARHAAASPGARALPTQEQRAPSAGALGAWLPHGAPGSAPPAGGMPPAGEAADLDALLGTLEPAYEEARVCLKLYGVHPSQLLPDLRAELLQALAIPNTVVQTALRSGCVYLTLTALLSDAERQQLHGEPGASAALGRLLPLVRRLPAYRALLQTGDGSAALLVQPSSGRPAMLVGLPAGTTSLPQPVQLLAPLATTVGASCGCFRLRCPAALLDAQGGGLALHCRRGGAHLAVSLTRAGAAQPDARAGKSEPATSSEEEGDSGEDEAAAAAASTPAEWLDVDAWVPAGAVTAGQSAWGLYEFEVSRGALLGASSPVLVLPDRHAAVAAELAQLPRSSRAATVVRLVALVLRHLQVQEGGAGPGAAALQTAFPPLATTRLAAVACWLHALAVRASWPALASLMHSAATLGCADFGTGAEQVPAAPAAAPAGGLPASGAVQPAAALPASPKKVRPLRKAGASGSAVGAQPIAGPPGLCAGDSLRCAMQPALLGGVSLLVAGVVLGMCWVLTRGYLG